MARLVWITRARNAGSVEMRRRVEQDYPDGALAIFKGPQRLASFPPAAPARAEGLAATRPAR